MFYSVFGLWAIKFLEAYVNPPMYKIASPQATNKELIQEVSRLGKPTIISVGGCTLDQIRDVVDWFSKANLSNLWWANLTLLHCVVAYPPTSELIGNLRDRINGSRLVSWGLSSHSEDIVSPVMAVALGATCIEKHFCLRPMPTPDGGKHSLVPEKFKEMVEAIRIAENHLRTQEQPTQEEMGNLKLARGGQR